MTDWTAKTALITGASKGIGLAIATSLAARGADVAIAARSEPDLRRAEAQLTGLGGGKVVAVTADLGIETQATEAVQTARERFGRLDILVNNAGGAAIGPFGDLTAADWDDAFRVKVFGAVYASRAALPLMVGQGSGSILNIVGNSAARVLPLQSASGSACAALAYLTGALAAEYGAGGIRVNALSPGPTATTRWDAVVQTVADLDEHRDADQVQRDFAAAVPRGSIGGVEEIARAALFLLSDDASFVNGSHLIADGGMTVAS